MTKQQNTARSKDERSFEKGLDDMIKGLRHAFNDMRTQLAQGVETSVTRKSSLETVHGPVIAEASVRLQISGVDLAGPEAFVDRSEPTLTMQEEGRLPISHDLQETQSGWRLVADIPGVTIQDLTLTKDQTTLVIQTEGARRYEARIALSGTFSLEDVAVTLRCGVLTLEIGKEPSE